MKKSNKIEQTYIYNGLRNKNYFISTANRESSAIYYPIIYAETLVWEYDVHKKETIKLIDQDESQVNSQDGHDRMINKYRK